MNAPEPDNEYEDLDFDDLLDDSDDAETDAESIEAADADATDEAESDSAGSVAREYSRATARAAKRKTEPREDEERLQKLIARAGVASRRAAEEMIFAGRVTVNDEVVREAGFKASRRDRIAVDGRVLRFPTGAATVVLLHKPVHVVTTKSDPQGRITVTDFLPPKLSHLHPIGRLDFDTTGLLLLTDDGELTQLLTHPSHGVEKVYLARVRGTVALATVKNLEAGIFLEDGKTAPCRVRVRAQTEKNALLQITLREGKNRQVRRMLEHVGHPASALRRVRVGNVEIEDIPAGAYRILLGAEVHELKKLATRGPKKTPQRKTASRAKTAAAPKSATTQPTRTRTRVSENTTRDSAAKPSRETSSTNAAPSENVASRDAKSDQENAPTVAARAVRPNRATSSQGVEPRGIASRDAASRRSETSAPKSSREYSQGGAASTRSTGRRDAERASENRPAKWPRETTQRDGATHTDNFSRGAINRERAPRAGIRGENTPPTSAAKTATPRANAPRRETASVQARSANARGGVHDDKSREYSRRDAASRPDVSRDDEARAHPLAQRIERSFERGARDTAAKQRREYAQQNAAREAPRQSATGAASTRGGTTSKAAASAQSAAPRTRGSGALHESKQPRTDKKPRGGGKNSRKKPQS